MKIKKLLFLSLGFFMVQIDNNFAVPAEGLPTVDWTMIAKASQMIEKYEIMIENFKQQLEAMTGNVQYVKIIYWQIKDLENEIKSLNKYVELFKNPKEFLKLTPVDRVLIASEIKQKRYESLLKSQEVLIKSARNIDKTKGEKESLDLNNYLQMEQMKLAQSQQEISLLKQKYDEAAMINRYNSIDKDSCNSAKKLGIEDLAKIYCNKVVDEKVVKTETTKNGKVSSKEVNDFLNSNEKETILGTATLRKTPDGKVEVIKNGEKIFSGDWRLGQTSERYESGGKGPGTINGARAAAADKGGWSYGKYQIATNSGTMNQYLKTSKYKDEFRGLKPGTQAFNQKWKEVAQRDPQGFSKDQHKFIERTHYAPQMEKLKRSGIDLSNRGPAVQDAVWSTSVQYGARSNTIKRALNGKNVNNMTDSQIITAIQNNKLKNVHSDFKSSDQKVQNSVKVRIRSEMKKLLSLTERKN